MPGYVQPPPPPSGGLGSLIGALVLITVDSFTPSAVTPWGIKDQVDVTCRVIEHPTDRTQEGRTITTPATNTVLVSQLRGIVGQTTLGRLVYGKQTQGNPPIRLDPPTPADEAKADQFLAAAPQAPQQPQGAAVPPAAGPPAGYPGAVPAYAGNGAQIGAQPGYTAPPAQPAWQPGAGQPEQPPF